MATGAKNVRVIVMGAGMAGILSGIRLLLAGIDCVIYEKADRVGGTWRENTYPGLISCFRRAYAQLHSEDFFGVKDRRTSTLNLPDRLNLKFKLGNAFDVQFSTEEQVFVDLIAAGRGNLCLGELSMGTKCGHMNAPFVFAILVGRHTQDNDFSDA
jgi:cation diffusion facilitator CzcD-associated flavoprotein CzcO